MSECVCVFVCGVCGCEFLCKQEYELRLDKCCQTKRD